MKKRIFPLLAIATMALLATGCKSYKQVPYFQNIEEISLEASKGLYDVRIKPKDMLTITVNSDDPTGQTEMPFNLLVRNTLMSNSSIGTSSGSLQTYLVENDGSINFPVIGRINVGGKTKSEVENYITERIRPYIKPDNHVVVTVRMANFRVTVTGEVNRPGVISVASEKMSILEAIAQAGDLSIYGKRQNVILLREDATGQKNYVKIDLTDANIINSPYYYVQQNDIIYVTPNATKAKNSDIGQSTTLWFSATSILISLTSLLYNILK